VYDEIAAAAATKKIIIGQLFLITKHKKNAPNIT
jgi:hypothetical protein